MMWWRIQQIQCTLRWFLGSRRSRCGRSSRANYRSIRLSWNTCHTMILQIKPFSWYDCQSTLSSKVSPLIINMSEPFARLHNFPTICSQCQSCTKRKLINAVLFCWINEAFTSTLAQKQIVSCGIPAFCQLSPSLRNLHTNGANLLQSSNAALQNERFILECHVDSHIRLGMFQNRSVIVATYSPTTTKQSAIGYDWTSDCCRNMANFFESDGPTTWRLKHKWKFTKLWSGKSVTLAIHQIADSIKCSTTISKC